MLRWLFTCCQLPLGAAVGASAAVPRPMSTAGEGDGSLELALHPEGVARADPELRMDAGVP